MSKRKYFKTLEEAKYYQRVEFRKDFKGYDFKPIILKRFEGQGYMILVPEK